MTGDRAMALYQEIVTVGIRPRLRSRKRRNVFCVSCGVSIALGPPPEGFAHEVYEMLRDVVRQNPCLMEAAYDQLLDPSAQPRRLPGSISDKALEVPVLHGAA
jgi:hypothetical protein